ncbi:hypothetical protein [Lentzea sp. NPDC051838]|uniref:hypothetical protein n=1 Tax=Lentzea sp. NPDC051838 TaxID=3154849 RepID=UPI0034294FA5
MSDALEITTGAMPAFVSYSNSDGGFVASAVVDAMHACGVDVLWDGDLERILPLSIPAWIETSIRDRAVLVIVTEDYVKALSTNDCTDHLGVRYEAGLVRQKIYDHGGASRCPVLPVVPPGMAVNSLPWVLRQRVLHTFDPLTRGGVEQLVRSVVALGQGQERSA